MTFNSDYTTLLLIGFLAIVILNRYNKVISYILFGLAIVLSAGSIIYTFMFNLSLL